MSDRRPDRRSDSSTGFCKTRDELIQACGYFTERGLAQATIATRIGVAKATVCRIQLGDKNPEYIEPQRVEPELRALANQLWTCRVSSF